MEVVDLKFSGLKLIKPKVFRDTRGFFLESYRKPLYLVSGIECEFVQDNLALSKKDTIRGMHYQANPGQDKLISVVSGEIYDVVVDIRPISSTYGQWYGISLDAEECHQLFIPKGFAHGYCVLSDEAKISYKVSNVFDPDEEKGFRWDDPEIGIKWPTSTPILSLRDLSSPFFSEVQFI